MIEDSKNMLNEFNESKVHTIVLNYKKSIRSFIYSVITVFRHVDNHGVNVIHVHMFHTLLITSLIKLFKTDIKIIFTLHNNFVPVRLRRWVLWLLKPFRDIDTIFSEDALQYFHKNVHKVIPNGIDISEYAIRNCIETVKNDVKVADARDLPFDDNSFDLVIVKKYLYNYS